MLDFIDGASAHEKSYIAVGQLPELVENRRPPYKKAPFTTISRHALVHTAELIMPSDVYKAIWSSMQDKLAKPRYIQVIMPLIAVLEGEFFNTFVKSGSALMQSEGHSGVDDVFSLHNGTLTLQVGKEKYERSGLTGKPLGSGGRKHAKERFAIEIDLRQPSMLHGKRGFERIVWACRNVLNASLTWVLVCEGPSQYSLEQAVVALAKYHPRIVDCRFEDAALPVARIPPLSLEDITASSSPRDLEDYCNEVSEWLALVSLRSPRVSVDDVIDPYLSRYAVPDAESTHQQPTALVSLRWQGVMTSRWITQLFTLFLLQQGNSNSWAALSASAFRRVAVENADGYTILSVPGKERPMGNSFISWDFIGASLCT